MATMRLTFPQDVPTILLHPDGGVLDWQDWMCDSLGVLTDGPEGKPDTLILLSFQSGAPLAMVALSPEERQKLSLADACTLGSSDLEGTLHYEGMLVKNEPVDVTGSFFEGIKRQARGDLPGAIAAYETAWKTEPRLLRLNNLLGLCLRLAERIPEAEQSYLREIEMAPQFPDAYSNLGILYLKTHRPQLARTMFEKALDRDQFYPNALLQLARLAAAEGPAGAPLLSSLNLRLLSVFPDLPQVQDHLIQMAGHAGQSPSEYAGRLRAEGGLLSEPQLLSLMRRVESLRLNGGLVAAARGFHHLLQKIQGHALEGYFLHWVARRLHRMGADIPPFVAEVWKNASGDLRQKFPALDQQDLSRETAPLPRRGSLSGEEFFELALTEILRDGQITPAETNIVFRLKNALRIDEKLHQELFARVEARLVPNLQVDEGGDFEPRRLLRQLAIAIARDGALDSQERKLLALASEALDLLPEEVHQALHEVGL